MQMRKDIRCAVVNNRVMPGGLSEEEKTELGRELWRLICEEGVNYFLTDMMPGTAMTAARMVLQFRTQFPYLALECIIPFERQAVKWNEKLREEYFDIIENCDRETMICRSFTVHCWETMDRYCSERSQFAVLQFPTDAGDRSASRFREYARVNGCRIINIGGKASHKTAKKKESGTANNSI